MRFDAPPRSTEPASPQPPVRPAPVPAEREERSIARPSPVVAYALGGTGVVASGTLGSVDTASLVLAASGGALVITSAALLLRSASSNAELDAKVSLRPGRVDVVATF